ncbi:uncharacterized protein EV420DRAFT_355219 [Desarmillaria tabescens]|uniref:Uncharacterized protein n=1 Tax=Armillaria tabescens TaxID=1929756 RepID=A0AA39KC34_ARMTA|nr:uncharacterized protein EV420DRAFT_355219 [Desarmillaria tabescens]KAK0458422.1 hypothetical protein EV420DRAFT_355219 [Desarmillaria tabescens]
MAAYPALPRVHRSFAISLMILIQQNFRFDSLLCSSIALIMRSSNRVLITVILCSLFTIGQRRPILSCPFEADLRCLCRNCYLRVVPLTSICPNPNKIVLESPNPSTGKDCRDSSPQLEDAGENRDEHTSQCGFSFRSGHFLTFSGASFLNDFVENGNG